MNIPGEAVMTGHFLVIEYMMPDGTFHFKSECVGPGKEDLSLGKALELLEFGKAQTIAPIMAEALSEYEILYDDDDDEGDEYEFEVDGE